MRLAWVMAAAMLAGPAAAQDMGWSTIIPSVTGTDTLGLALRERAEQSGQARTVPDTRHTNPKPAAPDAATLAALRYTPSKERRAANMASFVAKTRKADAKAGDDLAKSFAASDLVEEMRAPLSKYGLRIDDVADAYTVWWANSWQASRGVDDDLSNATVAAIRRQVVGALTQTGAIRGASDAAKQELAETLLIQGAIMAAAVAQAKGQPELMPTVRAGALRSAQGMGLDLSKMELTETGFVFGG